MPALPALSVIVPAYDEAGIIERSLRALLTQADAPPYEVVVAANGCSDDTVARAEALRPLAEARGVGLTVLDIETPGKIGALNRADAVARGPARVYCDADLVVTDNLVAETARALKAPEPLYVSYRLEVAPSRSRVTRAYGRMWRRLPLLDREPHGIALYGLNAAGARQRGPYPDIVADDHFARLSFAPGQRRRLDAVAYEFVLPEGLGELVQVRTRWSRGNEELARARPDLLANEFTAGRYDGFGRALARDPVGALAFVGVWAVGKVQGRRTLASGNKVWERAAQSRR